MSNKKTTKLDELSTLASTDLIIGIDDVSGTPTTTKVEIDTLDDYLSASEKTLTNKTLTSPKINEDVAVTSTASELNILDGVTADKDEINILDGVTATATEINVLDDIPETLTSTELGYVDGVTSAIQTQMNLKAPLASPTLTGTVVLPNSQIITTAVLNTSFSGTAKATGAEINTGTEDAKIVTPKAIADSYIGDNNNNSMYRQAIINGNFDVWQRGTSFDASTAYKPDRWRTTNSGAVPTGTVTRQAFTVGQTVVPNNPNYFYRTTITDTTSVTNIGLRNRIEDVGNFSGMDVTVSFWAKSDSASGDSVGVYLAQNFGSGGSAEVETTEYSKDLTDSWQKFTQTISVASISGKTVGVGNFLSLEFRWPVDTFVIDIAQVQLCAGDVALPFQPKSYEDELRACQRSCRSYHSNNETLGTGWATSTTSATIFFPLGVPMRTAPTLTATASQWRLYDLAIGAIAVTVLTMSEASTKDFAVLIATTASGLTQYRPYTLLDDETHNRLLIFNAEL